MPIISMRYEMDNESFGYYMISNEVNDAVGHVAELVLAEAKATAPRGTGELAASYEAHSGGIMAPAGDLGLRPVWLVGSRSRYAAIIEFGSSELSGASNPRFRVLGRAAGKFGDWHGDK